MKPRLKTLLLAGVLACESDPGDADDATFDPCDDSIEAYCATRSCNPLSVTQDETCDPNGYGPFLVVQRCGDDGSAWMTHSGDTYLFEHTRRWYDATGTLVAARFTQDYELDCGGFSQAWGEVPTCDAGWCTWFECNWGYGDLPPACEGGADPPPPQ